MSRKELVRAVDQKRSLRRTFLDHQHALVADEESNDPSFLRDLFNRFPSFKSYQLGWGNAFTVYNNVGVLFRHFERVWHLLLLLRQCSTVGDFGCGFGNLGLELANQELHVILIDVFTDGLKVAKERAARRGLDVHMVRADATRSPFKDAALDATFSNQVIEHVSNPSALVSEQVRVAKKRIVIISETKSFTVVLGSILHPREHVPQLKTRNQIHIGSMLPINSRGFVQFLDFLLKTSGLNRHFATNSIKTLEVAGYRRSAGAHLTEIYDIR